MSSRPIVWRFAVLCALAGATGASAQQAVTGRVVNAGSLAPLSGALVTLADGNAAVLTNTDGRFSIQAPGTGTLVFTLLGFGEQRVPIQGRTIVNITMTPTAVALDELVVVGYGAQSRAMVTGSVSSVSEADLGRNSASTTASALVGRMQGINTRMTTSGNGTTGGGGGTAAGAEAVDGRPGSSTVLQIRNMGEPLVVIDGVPQSMREFNHLNAADIENVSILKDASAAVYGLRAANGVVLVTTKKGSQFQAPTVRVAGYYGWQDLTRNPYKHMMSAYEHQFGQVESQQNLGQPRNISSQELDLWRVGAPGYESYNQYADVVNNPHAAQYNLNASVSGGSPNGVQYYLSFGNVRQDYVMKDNTFGRSNFQTNLQTRVLEGWTIGTELSGRFEKTENIGVGGNADVMRQGLQTVSSFRPIDRPYANDNPNYINYDVRFLNRSPAFLSREIAGTQDDIRQGMSGNFWTEYVFPFGLQARGTYSYRSNLNKFDLHRYTWDAYSYNKATDTYNLVYTYPGALRSQYRATDERDFAQLTLNYKTALGRHSLSGLAGLEVVGEEANNTRVDAVPPTNFSHIISYADQSNLANNWSISRRASYVGRFNYDYGQKYLLEVLGRYDGSYLYDPGQRWGLFPGFSAGWRITEEPFVRNRFDFVDELKLRASWGQAGREQGVTAWGYLGGATYGVGSGSIFRGQQVEGARPRGVPATNLSWVTSTSTNVGFDLSMFDNRIGLVFDVFERRLTGLPAARYDVLLPIEAGYTLPNENLNSEAIRGFEGAVTWSDEIGGLSFSLAPNFTFARNIILDVYKPRYGNSWDRYRNGTQNRLAGVNFGYKVVGQFQTMEEIENHPINNDEQSNLQMLPGDLIFEDINGDGIINPMDQVPIARPVNATPMLNFGMASSLSYGGVNLNIDWAGGSMFAFRAYGELSNAFWNGYNASKLFTNRWHRVDPYNDQSEWVPGHFPPTRIGQNFHPSNRNETNLFSDFYWYNVVYLRMRQVELSYDLPSSAAGAIGLGRFLVYSSVTNPLTFDNVGVLEIDPEVAGTSALVYPTSRLISIGFRAEIGGQSIPMPSVPVAPSVGDE